MQFQPVILREDGIDSCPIQSAMAKNSTATATTAVPTSEVITMTLTAEEVKNIFNNSLATCAINTTVGDLNTKIGSLDSKLQVIGNRLDTLEGNMRDSLQLSRDASNVATEAKNRVGALEVRVETVEKKDKEEKKEETLWTWFQGIGAVSGITALGVAIVSAVTGKKEQLALPAARNDM